jgi:hypothetical protein
MKIKAGKHAWASTVQKGNRVEYVYSGVKYVGSVVCPLMDSYEIEIQADGIEGTHVVQEDKVRLIKASKRYRSMQYAIRNNIPFMD